MRTLRKIFLVWMLAWLPISGAIASVMPLCGHDDMTQAVHDHEHMAGQGTAHDHDSSLQPDANSAHDVMHFLCGNCNLCHLASSVVPPSVSSSTLVLAGSTPSVPLRLDFSTFYPETPQHPPLSPRT